MYLNIYFNLITALSFIYFYIISPLSNLLTYNLYSFNSCFHLLLNHRTCILGRCICTSRSSYMHRTQLSYHTALYLLGFNVGICSRMRIWGCCAYSSDMQVCRDCKQNPGSAMQFVLPKTKMDTSRRKVIPGFLIVDTLSWEQYSFDIA